MQHTKSLGPTDVDTCCQVVYSTLQASLARVGDKVYPARVVDESICPLGRWLARQRQEDMFLNRARRAHRAFHIQAACVALSLSRGDRESAEVRLKGRLAQAREELMGNALGLRAKRPFPHGRGEPAQ